MKVSPKEIIESGILEEYVLGLLPEKEAENPGHICSDTISALCISYPEILLEIQAIETVLIQSLSVNVNPEWKKSILSSLTSDEYSEQENNGGRIIGISSIEKKNSISQKWFWAAASFAGLFMLSVAGNFILLNKNQLLSQELTDTKVQLLNEADEKSVFAAKYQESKNDYLQLFNANVVRIKMVGTPNFPNHNSILYWDKVSGDVVWHGSSLPELPSEHQYQLWVIVDGQPQNIGVLTSEHPNKMLNTTSAHAFAVTIEPKGGSPTPTLDKMVVMAQVENEES